MIVHAAYVLNTATCDETKWGRAAAGLTKELERSTALGVGGVCFHPGAATDGDRTGATARVARAITQALSAAKGSTRILVENTAGAGLTIGRTPDEVGAILGAVPAALRARTGYGLDTCHLFAAGHDITASSGALTAVLDAFEAATGEPPRFCISTTARVPWVQQGPAHADRGGEDRSRPFRWLLKDRRSAGIPLILETPQERPDVAEDDPRRTRGTCG